MLHKSRQIKVNQDMGTALHLTNPNLKAFAINAISGIRKMHNNVAFVRDSLANLIKSNNL